MKQLTAKKFISVLDLIEMDYTLPTGLQLVDEHGTDKGVYLQHIQSADVNYHTLQNYQFQSTPFPIHAIGIIVEVPFASDLIDYHLFNHNNAKQN